jgi:hypothetical protein
MTTGDRHQPETHQLRGPRPAHHARSALHRFGFGKITGWEGTAGYMASNGMPMIPVFLVIN